MHVAWKRCPHAFILTTSVVRKSRQQVHFESDGRSYLGSTSVVKNKGCVRRFVVVRAG
jgi:hypothetical protein